MTNLVILILLWLSSVKSHDEEEVKATFHCMNETVINNGKDGDAVHYHCVLCFFPQHCLENNTCLEGTTGYTCEKCISKQKGQKGYFRVGNTCVACEDIPLAAIGFGLYILFFSISSIANGFTASLCTKLKIICHFLQLTYLSFHIKVRWPELLQKVMKMLNFSNFNSKILDLGCLFPDIVLPMRVYYLDWSTSFLILIATVIATFFLDRSLRLVISNENVVEKVYRIWKKRSQLRRFATFIIVTMYMPIAMSAIHTILCTDNISLDVLNDQAQKSIFLFEQDQLCTSFVFQALHFVAILILVFFVILLPLFLAFFTLRQRKWDLLQKTKKNYGSVYESYEPRCCYWEVIPMYRKMLSIAVTDIYPLSQIIQSAALLSLTCAYLLLLIIFRPYKPIKTSSSKIQMHHIFEILSNIVIATLQAFALLITLDLYANELDYVILFFIGTVVFVGVIMVLFTPMELKQEEELTEADLEDDEMSNMPTVVGILKKKNKVAPEPKTFEEETKEHQKNIAF